VSEPEPGAARAEVDSKRVAALVHLIADESASVREAAEAALDASRVTPAELRAHVEALEDPAQRTRVRARLEARRLDAIERELEATVAREAPLEAGALLLARVVAPDLDAAACSRELDRMAAELKQKIPAAPLRARARALAEFIHGDKGFRGDTAHYDDPENALLDRVLERRTGIPTSLALVYLLLGRRLDLPLEGVPLAIHFLVRCADGDGEIFIDAFAGGRFLTRTDCWKFLQAGQQAGKFKARPEFLLRASDREVLSRLADSLVRSYRTRGAEALALRFERCAAIADPGRGEGSP
jgi:regulator of sirC expression with transglutaminase-like and TPR domain